MRAADIAYGDLGLLPEVFGRLTPAEFTTMARAAARARQERNDVIASMTAHLMNVSGKRVRKHVTPDDLLVLNAGRPRTAANAGLLAAGTGLGQSVLCWDGSRRIPSPSEGGHGDFAPHNKLLTTLINAVGVRNTDGSLINNFGAFGEAGEFTELKA